MTERIYYTKSYQEQFSGTIVAIQERDNQTVIQLDRTCFYPTSGGQPFDTGQLAGHQVTDVFVDEKGDVQHTVVQCPDYNKSLTVGISVTGIIDWPRRHDHMQQHSGQHLLSQAFFERLGVETVAVHFGEVESTLDLAIQELQSAQIEQIERYANDIIYRALPISTYFVDEKKLSTIPLRRPPKVQGTIRIVEISKFDYSACGGTHVQNTAEIGPLKLTKLERRRNQVRVTFLCGLRALEDYRVKHRLITEAAMIYSNEIYQVPSLITRNLALLKERERVIEENQKALLRYEVVTLMENATMLGPVRIIQHIDQEKSSALLKALATDLQRHTNIIALLSTIEDEKVTLCFVSDPALTEQYKLHIGQLLRTALQPQQGKGGGKTDFAQGGGITAEQIPLVFATAYQQLQELFDH